MSKDNKIKLFQGQNVRTHWDADKESATNFHTLSLKVKNKTVF